MKNGLKLCLVFLMLTIYCGAGEVPEETAKLYVQKKLETLRSKLRKDNLEAKSGSVMLYEFSRSKDDAKFMAEIFKTKNNDQTLMRLWMKGKKAKTHIYLDLKGKESRLMMLSEERKNGVEMNGLTNIIKVLRPLSNLMKAMNKEADEEAEDINFHPQVYLHLKGDGITSSLGLVSARSLPWEALDEDVSGIEKSENFYKIKREKHGGYFIIDKKTGVLLEQRETLDGQTRTMKLISNKRWNGKIEALLPDYSDYQIERKELDESMVDQMTGGMFTDMLKAMILDEKFAAKIEQNPKKVHQDLKVIYSKLWRSNKDLMVPPTAWELKKKKFLNATKQWTATEEQAWKKKDKNTAIKELREKYLPKQNEFTMELIFELAAKDIELDEAGEKRKKLVLGAITRALYESWAEVQVETFLESL